MSKANHAAEDIAASPTHQALTPASVSPIHVATSRPALAAAAEVPPPAAAIALNPAISRWLSNRLVVVSLLAIAGPLGLPALWLSPRFSRTAKILTTALFLFVTVVFPLALAYYWLEIALRPLVDVFGEVHG